ncbi:hypothetical protein [Clostridium felsineum]|uniref:hypothetical protein n=1 Tax=Clostridium felsineum TaxID=36839 RepID=UPI001115AC55|nr:hypothetical protein [Clostridium felsineum]
MLFIVFLVWSFFADTDKTPPKAEVQQTQQISQPTAVPQKAGDTNSTNSTDNTAELAKLSGIKARVGQNTINLYNYVTSGQGTIQNILEHCDALKWELVDLKVSESQRAEVSADNYEVQAIAKAIQKGTVSQQQLGRLAEMADAVKSGNSSTK